jgi:MFS family permease
VIADAAGSELSFGPAVVGFIAGAYWAASSVTSLSSGSLVNRLSSGAIMVISGLLALLSLCGSVLVSPSWPWLLGWAALGGVANALGHPASNDLIRRDVPVRRRALSFGVKQAAVPAASIITGASIPLLLSQFGWRSAYAPGIVLVLGVVVAAIIVRRRSRATSRADVVGRVPQVGIPMGARPFLLAVAATTFLAAAHSNSMGVFAVTGALERGLSADTTGLLLVLASATAVVVRTGVGYLADRGGDGSLRGVVALLAVGTVGLVIMSAETPGLFIVGWIFAFAGSWGWPGLIHYVVAHVMGAATPGATLVTQSGSYIGSALGPVLFGLAFSGLGAGIPWLLMAVCALLAAASAMWAQRLLRRGF